MKCERRMWSCKYALIARGLSPRIWLITVYWSTHNDLNVCIWKSSYEYDSFRCSPQMGSCSEMYSFSRGFERQLSVAAGHVIIYFVWSVHVTETFNTLCHHHNHQPPAKEDEADDNDNDRTANSNLFNVSLGHVYLTARREVLHF